MRGIVASALFVLLTAAPAPADAVAAGTLSWQGKSVSYKVSSTNTANVSASSNDERCIVRLDLDGKKHEVQVTRAGLEYQGKKIALDRFTRIEVRTEEGELRILVDGRQVVPPLKK